MISELVYRGCTHYVAVGNSIDGYQRYPQYGYIVKKSPLRDLQEKKFENFLDTSEEKETTEEKTKRISYGFIFRWHDVPCADGLNHCVLCLMPLVEEEKELTPLLKQYYRKFVKKEHLYNVVRFVHDDNNEIKAVYFNKESECVKNLLNNSKKESNIAAIARCHFVQKMLPINRPAQSFDNYQLLKLDAKVRFYPTPEMYKEDYDEFQKRIKKPPQEGIVTRVSKTFLGSKKEDEDLPLKSRIKKTFLGKK